VINTSINRKATAKVARALGNLNKEVVFVGGAMVSLYADDKAAEDVRPTKDLDLSFNITTVAELEKLRVDLVKKGFHEAVDETVICRFKYEDLLIDVMSTQMVGWAPSNRWFQQGYNAAIEKNVEELTIKIMPLPFFLASKLDAFFNRGVKDLYGSRDLEDIVYLLNYTIVIVTEVKTAEREVKTYLAESFNKMLLDTRIMAAIEGHIYPAGNEEVYLHIKDVMTEISKL
jgi:hypothetical protein